MKKALVFAFIGDILIFLGGATFVEIGIRFFLFFIILSGIAMVVGALFSANEDGNGKLLQLNDLKDFHIYEVVFCGCFFPSQFVVLLRDQKGKLGWYQFIEEPPKIFKVSISIEDNEVTYKSYP